MSDPTIILTLLAALGALLFAIATRVSEALVRARARHLPTRIAGRMEEEWLAELNAIASRPGKLAFAIALTLTRRQAFAGPGEDSMTEPHDRPAVGLAAFNGRKTLLILPTLILATAAYGASFLLPVRYASESLILVQPRQIPSSFVVDLLSDSREDRLKSIEQIILSRSILSALVGEFSSELAPKAEPLDRTIAELRKDITIQFPPTPEEANPKYFRVRYVGRNAELARKVAARLTLALLQIDNSHRELQLEGTRDFLRHRLDDLATRLTETGDKLAHERAAHGLQSGRILAIDYEQLVSTYKATFAKLEDVQMAFEVELDRKGEQFLIQVPADLGTPVIPNRLGFAGLGAVAGFALGGMAVFSLNRRQRRALA